MGYVPSQPKVAVIELDKMDKPLTSASIYRIEDDGSEKMAFMGKTDVWGMYYKYNYMPRYVKSADGKRSGTPDDMWAFTNRNTNTDMNAANMFAAASRVLKGYNDDLAARCLKQSKRLQAEATQLIGFLR